ncbi:MAG: hypothetical protein FJX72_03950 [Armatimonadetes bacterium]|nr:hypothetical protein [Armatimonadota bacterium]
MGSWIPHPASVNRDRAGQASHERPAPDEGLPRLYTKGGAFASFEDLPRLYTRNTFDLQEWAQYWQAVIVHNRYDSYHHVDGIYDFRDDLGGIPAFAEGVACVRQIGRHVGLYIGSKTIRNDSRIFQGDFAGTHPEDWMLMEAPDAKLPGPDKDGQLSFWACPRYAPWQDHIARLCRDLLRQTGAKYIRLDELGEAFVVCHNPKHRHASPYAGTQEILQFLKKVRAAMDEVDPQAALYTEGAADLMQISCDGTLAMWASGSEIAPMRLVIPGFVGLAYNLGQVECALQGWVTYVTDACSGGGWWNPHHAGLWGSGLVKRPPGYPAEGKGAGPALRWHEVGATFVDAVRRGTAADRDPVADGKPADEWAGRIWMARDYWVMTCGDLAARVPGRPVAVRVPGLPADVHHAYEIDLATLTVRDARLQRSGSDATVTLAAGFSAVLLPRPTCPPLVQVADVPPLPYGQATMVHIKAFAPWRSDSGAVKVTLSVPGLLAAPKSVVLPATVRIEPRTGAEPGFYALKVTGRALPLKRWIRYGESDR